MLALLTMRLIPEIEKNERLVALADTFAGRGAITALFLLILFSFDPGFYTPLSWQVIMVSLLFGLAPLRVPDKMALGSLLMLSRGLPWGFGSAATKSDQAQYVQQAYISFIDSMGAGKPIYYLCAIVAVALLGLACLWILRKMKARFPALWLFLAWCLAMMVALNTQSISPAFQAVWLTIGIFSLCLFSMAYICLAKSETSPATHIGFTLQAFFVMPPFSLVRHPSLIEKPIFSPAVCRLKALKLILWSRLLAIALQGMHIVFFNRLGLENFNWLGLAEFNAHGLPWYHAFGARFVQTICLSLFLSVNTGVAIAFFRLAGIYLPRAVCRPYLARSFNDYYRRILFYYSDMIVHLFFYPLYEKAYSLIANRALRVQVTLFASLFLGGWIFHVVIMWQNFFFFGWRAASLNAVGWLPYFAAVGVCCGISQGGWVYARLKNLPLAVHFLLNLTLHSLLMTFMQYSIGESLGDRFNFFRSMLPF